MWCHRLSCGRLGRIEPHQDESREGACGCRNAVNLHRLVDTVPIVAGRTIADGRYAKGIDIGARIDGGRD